MKVTQQWVRNRIGRVQSFMLILGRVGLGITLVMGRVKKIGPTPRQTLVWRHRGQSVCRLDGVKYKEYS